MTYAIHIAAGALALLAGYVALWSAKGAALHRRSGTVFVATMLVMCGAGTWIAATRNVAPSVNVPAGLITAYLVATSLGTVRPHPFARWLAPALTALALGVGIITLTFAFDAVANGGTRDGMPAFPFFLFGITGIAAGVSDVRIIRHGVPRGPARLVRHLWRMTFALLVAALSLFIGQADELPPRYRIMPLLALPVLAVLVTMIYWLWKVRVRRWRRGVAGVAAGQSA